jgi:ribonuclease HI
MNDIETAVTIFTDGACSRNPGPGGWAVLLILNDAARFISGYEKNTTNNRMELYAAISALKILKRSAIADIHTDSLYLKDGISRWIHAWQRNNWKTANNKPVLNRDLWIELSELVKIHHVRWIWVRGHSTDLFNNFVDLLARRAILRKSGEDIRLSVPELKEILHDRQVPWQN